VKDSWVTACSEFKRLQACFEETMTDYPLVSGHHTRAWWWQNSNQQGAEMVTEKLHLFPTRNYCTHLIAFPPRK